MSSSVQFDSGNTRMFSPLRTLVLYMSHSSGLWFLGSHWWNLLRNEKMRSLALDFSSSRRAPPKAASNLYLSSALSSACVFIRSVCTLLPWVNGPTPSRKAFMFDSTMSFQPWVRAYSSRNSIISLNFHFESMCISGKGGLPG